MIKDIQPRDGLVHTLGSLTLVTVRGNTAASDSAFADKKPWLLKSLLALNLEVTSGDTWPHTSITDRSTDLAKRAATVWQSL